jgi:hypothetical protein
MNVKHILIVAVSLLALTSSCTKEDEDKTSCEWFPADKNNTYKKTAKDTSTYNSAATDNSVNFDGIVFQSEDCESISISVNGGQRIPAWKRYVGTAKLFDDAAGDVTYLAYQSDTAHTLDLNGFTYNEARNGYVRWKHRTGFPNGEVSYWFGENIGILALYNTYRQHADSPTIYTTYELR